MSFPSFPSFARVSSLALLLAPLAACGDDSSTGTGGGGGSTSSTGATTTSTTTTGATTTGPGTGGGTTTGTTTGSGGEGGQAPPAFGDDCATPEDCFGSECVEINGHRTCRAEVQQATLCAEPTLDECCDTSECGPDEICTLMPDVYCGGPAPILANQCVSTDDTCLQLDCGKSDAACAPPGVFGFSEARCLPRACRGDDDCTEGSGGSCVPVADPCCNGVVGYFCAYSADGCRNNSDCVGGEYCQPDFETGTATCVEGVPQCPA